MKKLLSLMAICFLTAGFGIMAHSSLTAVAEADTFTVQFGTVNYSAAADKQGFAFFDFLFDGKNAGAFTDEELDAAIEPAKQYIYLNDKALSELSGEYYYLQHVKESENRNTLSINLPKLDFIYNWTGTGWNYENIDFSRLDNYKVEVRKGLTIGGKTLAESYVMYYNNVAHVWTHTPITTEPDRESDSFKISAISPFLKDSSENAGFTITFSGEVTNKQLMFYNASLDHVKYWSGADDDDFARAVCWQGWRSLQDVKINYTVLSTGKEISTTIGQALDTENMENPDQTVMVHYLKDSANPSYQPMSITFNKAAPAYFPDITKPFKITFQNGFQAENGNEIAFESTYTWYPEYDEWRQEMDDSGIEWDDIKPVSVSKPEEQAAGNVAFYITFNKNITDKSYMFFNADNSWLLSMSEQPGSAFTYSADELVLLTNYGIKGSVLDCIYFNNMSLGERMRLETDPVQRPVTIMVHLGYTALNQMMIVFSGQSANGKPGANAITDLNQTFEFRFTSGLKTPKCGQVTQDYTFVYDTTSKEFSQKFETSSESKINAVYYNGIKLEKGGEYNFGSQALKEEYFYIEGAQGAVISFSGLEESKGKRREITVRSVSSDNTTTDTFTFYVTDNAKGCTQLVEAETIFIAIAAMGIATVGLRRKNKNV